MSIFGDRLPAARLAVEELPAGPRRGRKPGSKNKPTADSDTVSIDPTAILATPVSVRGSGGVQANVEKTARVMEARAANPPVIDEAKAAAERKRKLDADIRRWTTTKRR